MVRPTLLSYNERKIRHSIKNCPCCFGFVTQIRMLHQIYARGFCQHLFSFVLPILSEQKEKKIVCPVSLPGI